MSEEVVSLARVGALGQQLGAGGQAEVFAAPNASLVDAPWPLVYKRYRPANRRQHSPERLVRYRNRLDPAHRQRLDNSMTWPLRVVEDGGRPVGVLLRLIPPGFMQRRRLPGSGVIKTTLREVQHLMIPPARAAVIGMPVPDLRQRLDIGRDLAAALHLLHRDNLVFGDLNAKNELFRTDDRPTVMFIDCDAVRFSGNAAAVDQLDSPDWESPDRWLTMASDRYKFGLFMLRCFATGEQASTTRDPARADRVLDPEGRRLLRAALDDRPERRPEVKEWGLYLQSLLTGVHPMTAAGNPATAVVPPSQRQAAGLRRDPVSGRWIPV